MYIRLSAALRAQAIELRVTPKVLKTATQKGNAIVVVVVAEIAAGNRKGSGCGNDTGSGSGSKDAMKEVPTCQ